MIYFILLIFKYLKLNTSKKGVDMKSKQIDKLFEEIEKSLINSKNLDDKALENIENINTKNRIKQDFKHFQELKKEKK